MTAKSKSEMMKRLRAQRKKHGLILFNVWVKDDPNVKKQLQNYVKKLNKRNGVTYEV